MTFPIISVEMLPLVYVYVVGVRRDNDNVDERLIYSNNTNRTREVVSWLPVIATEASIIELKS